MGFFFFYSWSFWESIGRLSHFYFQSGSTTLGYVSAADGESDRKKKKRTHKLTCFLLFIFERHKLQTSGLASVLQLSEQVKARTELAWGNFTLICEAGVQQRSLFGLYGSKYVCPFVWGVYAQSEFKRLNLNVFNHHQHCLWSLLWIPVTWQLNNSINSGLMNDAVNVVVKWSVINKSGVILNHNWN